MSESAKTQRGDARRRGGVPPQGAAFGRRDFLKSAGALLGGLSLAGCGAAIEGAVPGSAAQRWRLGTRRGALNFVFFLVDDMGWMDSSTYGSGFYESPGMDRLARRGMRFTNAYAHPLCSPTRAAIMTGKYPGRLKFTVPSGHMPPNKTEPIVPKSAGPAFKVVPASSRTFLPLDEYTIAEALRDAGYATGHFGKWHLGGVKEYWASAQGFDVSFGGTGSPGPVGYFSPYFMENITDGPNGEYITDRVTDEALRFLETNRKKPFFINLWHFAVHGPWQGKRELIDKYAKKANPNNPQHNPVYAAMLESMDQSLGRVLDKLDELGLADSTALIFMSDNGGVLDTGRGDTHSPPYTEVTSNAPLRGGKATVYEGGTREPMMIFWPGVTPAGSLCDEPVAMVDFYPTMLEMAGLEPRPGQTIDGMSLVPLLRGAGQPRREAIYCHFPHYGTPDGRHGPLTQTAPATWVRKGDWKLIRLYGEGPERAPAHELYNLREDIGETRDQAADRPDLVEELSALIDRHLRETGALVPIPNPNYVPPVTEWKTGGNCTLERAGGMLKVKCTGMNASIIGPTFKMPGPVLVKLRVRRPVDNDWRWMTYPGRPKIAWRDENSANFGANPLAVFDVPHDGEWHEVTVPITTDKILAQLMIHTGYAPDAMDIASVRVESAGLIPGDATHAVDWQLDE
ncbi:MAG: sulfatase-like hydrolase/transferase [bacterium]|nr:sulfatase-like hydrolase/transferase [bacterium]